MHTIGDLLPPNFQYIFCTLISAVKWNQSNCDTRSQICRDFFKNSDAGLTLGTKHEVLVFTNDWRIIIWRTQQESWICNFGNIQTFRVNKEHLASVCYAFIYLQLCENKPGWLWLDLASDGGDSELQEPRRLPELLKKLAF